MSAHSEWAKSIGAHCGNCGAAWKSRGGRVVTICPSCKAGLPCRADTTDLVAPDPPCAGFRRTHPEEQ